MGVRLFPLSRKPGHKHAPFLNKGGQRPRSFAPNQQDLQKESKAEETRCSQKGVCLLKTKTSLGAFPLELEDGEDFAGGDFSAAVSAGSERSSEQDNRW